MGVKLSCVCNEDKIGSGEIDLISHKEPSVNLDISFGDYNVKGANLKRNTSKTCEELVEELKHKINQNNNLIEISVEDFESKFNDKIKQTLENLENIINEINSIPPKNEMLLKLPPVKLLETSYKEYYCGEWNSNGLKCGLGNFIERDGSIYYGYFSDNKYDGYGLYIKTSGGYYIGNWKEGMTNGKGILFEQSLKYEGLWKNNMRDGFGEEVFTDGSYYKGHFKNDEREGEGLFIWSDNTYYKGNFLNSQFNGFGESKWIDGRTYKGLWKDNKLHGKGVFTWPNGCRYEGEYQNDKKHGDGNFYWKNKSFYIGKWINNKQHGYGTITFQEKTLIGIWRYGKIIRIIENNDEKNDPQYYSALNNLINNTEFGN